MKLKCLPYKILKLNRINIGFRLPEPESNFEVYHLLKFLNKDVRISWRRGVSKLSSLLISEKPLSYILNSHPFLNTNLLIQNKVLIPRNETEQYVSDIIKRIQSERLNSNKKLRILDICSGSGCIAIALACNLRNVEVTAVDKYLQCCRNIKSNVERNRRLLESSGSTVSLKRGNVLDSNFYLSQKFDLIISNPPYISPSQKYKVDRNVLKYESHSALFSNNSYQNGIYFHSRIIHISDMFLNPMRQLARAPKIIMEFDGKHQVKPLSKKLKKSGFNKFKFKNDYQNIPRSVWIY